MHGLINRVIHRYIREKYGAATWRRVARRAGVQPPRFEGLQRSPDRVTRRLICHLVRLSQQEERRVLRDLGQFAVSHPAAAPYVQLLRFGGAGYAGFLGSLEDLPVRLQMLLPGGEVPDFEVAQIDVGRFYLICRSNLSGFGSGLVGLLEGMAEIYETPADIQHLARVEGRQTCDLLSVQLLAEQGRTTGMLAANCGAAV